MDLNAPMTFWVFIANNITANMTDDQLLHNFDQSSQ